MYLHASVCLSAHIYIYVCIYLSPCRYFSQGYAWIYMKTSNTPTNIHLRFFPFLNPPSPPKKKKNRGSLAFSGSCPLKSTIGIQRLTSRRQHQTDQWLILFWWTTSEPDSSKEKKNKTPRMMAISIIMIWKIVIIIPRLGGVGHMRSSLIPVFYADLVIKLNTNDLFLQRRLQHYGASLRAVCIRLPPLIDNFAWLYVHFGSVPILKYVIF